MTSFYTEVIMKDHRFFSPTRIGDATLLEPHTRDVVLAIIRDAKLLKGIQLEVFETYRSQDRQTKLYQQKASKLKDVGVHHYGLACDLVKWIDGEFSWKGDWTFLRDLAKSYDFISGYDWGTPEVPNRFVDACHIQRIAVKDQTRLFSGTWYPDESYVIGPVLSTGGV